MPSNTISETADRFNRTGNADLDAFIAYINTGHYVADVGKQIQFFGAAPPLADSVQRWIASTNLIGV